MKARKKASEVVAANDAAPPEASAPADAAPAPEAPEAAATVAGWWEDLLAGEGYRPKLEHNTDAPALSRIAFKADGVRFTLWLDEEDPDFYHFTGAYRLGDDAPGSAVLHDAVNAINERVKGIKVTLGGDDDVTFHAEAFQRGDVHPETVERILYQLRHAADDWFEKIRPHRRPMALA